jgi:hypothetical protein
MARVPSVMVMARKMAMASNDDNNHDNVYNSNNDNNLLHNQEYFGTYLGYLPTIPTSLHCDTFQLIPASFLGCLGHSTSSSTVELVSFSLVLLRNSMVSSQKLLELVMHPVCLFEDHFYV